MKHRVVAAVFVGMLIAGCSIEQSPLRPSARGFENNEFCSGKCEEFRVLAKEYLNNNKLIISGAAVGALAGAATGSRSGAEGLLLGTIIGGAIGSIMGYSVGEYLNSLQNSNNTQQESRYILERDVGNTRRRTSRLIKTSDEYFKSYKSSVEAVRTLYGQGLLDDEHVIQLFGIITTELAASMSLMEESKESFDKNIAAYRFAIDFYGFDTDAEYELEADINAQLSEYADRFNEVIEFANQIMRDLALDLPEIIGLPCPGAGCPSGLST